MALECITSIAQQSIDLAATALKSATNIGLNELDDLIDAADDLKDSIVNNLLETIKLPNFGAELENLKRLIESGDSAASIAITKFKKRWGQIEDIENLITNILTLNICDFIDIDGIFDDVTGSMTVVRRSKAAKIPNEDFSLAAIAPGIGKNNAESSDLSGAGSMYANSPTHDEFLENTRTKHQNLAKKEKEFFAAVDLSALRRGIISEEYGGSHGSSVKAQVSRYGFKGDSYQNWSATVNGSDHENLGNRNNILQNGVSVAISPELAEELSIGLKDDSYIEAFIDNRWQRFRVDDTTARGLRNFRLDFFDPTGKRISIDGSKVPVRNPTSEPPELSNNADYEYSEEAVSARISQIASKNIIYALDNIPPHAVYSQTSLSFQQFFEEVMKSVEISQLDFQFGSNQTVFLSFQQVEFYKKELARAYDLYKECFADDSSILNNVRKGSAPGVFDPLPDMSELPPIPQENEGLLPPIPQEILPLPPSTILDDSGLLPPISNIVDEVFLPGGTILPPL